MLERGKGRGQLAIAAAAHDGLGRVVGHGVTLAYPGQQFTRQKLGKGRVAGQLQIAQVPPAG